MEELKTDILPEESIKPEDAACRVFMTVLPNWEKSLSALSKGGLIRVMKAFARGEFEPINFSMDAKEKQACGGLRKLEDAKQIMITSVILEQMELAQKQDTEVVKKPRKKKGT